MIAPTYSPILNQAPMLDLNDIIQKSAQTGNTLADMAKRIYYAPQDLQIGDLQRQSQIQLIPSQTNRQLSENDLARIKADYGIDLAPLQFEKDKQQTLMDTSLISPLGEAKRAQALQVQDLVPAETAAKLAEYQATTQTAPLQAQAMIDAFKGGGASPVNSLGTPYRIFDPIRKQFINNPQAAAEEITARQIAAQRAAQDTALSKLGETSDTSTPTHKKIAEVVSSEFQTNDGKPLTVPQLKAAEKSKVEFTKLPEIQRARAAASKLPALEQTYAVAKANPSSVTDLGLVDEFVALAKGGNVTEAQVNTLLHNQGLDKFIDVSNIKNKLGGSILTNAQRDAILAVARHIGDEAVKTIDVTSKDYSSRYGIKPDYYAPSVTRQAAAIEASKPKTEAVATAGTQSAPSANDANPAGLVF